MASATDIGLSWAAAVVIMARNSRGRHKPKLVRMLLEGNISASHSPRDDGLGADGGERRTETACQRALPGGWICGTPLNMYQGGPSPSTRFTTSLCPVNPGFQEAWAVPEGLAARRPPVKTPRSQFMREHLRGTHGNGHVMPCSALAAAKRASV